MRNSRTQPVDFPCSSDLASFLPGPHTTVVNIDLQVRRHDQRAITFGSMMLGAVSNVSPQRRSIREDAGERQQS